MIPLHEASADQLLAGNYEDELATIRDILEKEHESLALDLTEQIIKIIDRAAIDLSNLLDEIRPVWEAYEDAI